MNLQDEFPAASLPDATWTENYCFVCYDPKSEVGLWSHLGRAPFDQGLWRELTMLYLPAGERLVNKSYGRTATDRGPGGALLSYQCEEPWKRWRLHRDGAVARTTYDALDTAMMGDQAQERVVMDLEFSDNSPIWNWGEVEDAHGWGKLHFEQLCDVRGSIEVGGETIAFDGAGIRDHTRGPRDFTVFKNHIWAWGNFPSGRGFILLALDVGGERLQRVWLIDDGEGRSADLHNWPVIESRGQRWDPYTLEIGDERIGAELLHQVPNGFAGANDICIGYDPAVVEAANFETFTRFTWDGEVGYGLTERAIKLR